MPLTVVAPRQRVRAPDIDWSQVGVFGGICFRATCRASGAIWFCKSSRRYYCQACAEEINAWRARKGETASCSRHVWFREPKPALATLNPRLR